MPLKTLVKVGSITNLSDARYCAGMGVDMLGFKVIDRHPNFITPVLYQQLRGWISGPKIIAEFQGMDAHTDIEGILQTFLPDFAEVTFKDYNLYRNRFSIPLIVAIEHDDFTASAETFDDVEMIVTEGNFLLEKFKGKTLVRPTSTEAASRLLETGKFDGIALEGSPEIRPGFKDYSDLSEILEMLEDN